MKVAIYARVSTDRQRERHTIASQLRELPEHAARQGWTVVETFKDDGRSGETVDGRPGFQRLLDAAGRKQFEAVLVIDLDRITRSKRSAEGALIYDHFREHGVKLCTPGQGVIDLEDEDQDLLAGIKRELAKWEKRKILSRTMRGKREAAKQGRRYGSLDPYGYHWVPDLASPKMGSYEIEESEARVVRLIYSMAVDEGLGRSMIAWRLNAEGHETRCQNRRGRDGKKPGRWAASTVGKILHRATYKGEFEVFRNSDRLVISVPAIVAPDVWARAQTALNDRKPQTKWKHGREYLLSGIARCGVCGAAMWAVNPRPGTHHKYAYYRCSSTNAWRRMHMTGPCGNKHHRVDQVDELVWVKLTEVLKDPELLARACHLQADDSGVGVDWAAQLRASQQKLQDLDRLVQEVSQRRRRGLITEEQCDRELLEVARERKLLERNVKLAGQQLAERVQRTDRVREIETQAAQLAGSLGKAAFERRREVVALLFPREHGCSVVLQQRGDIEARGILPFKGEEHVEIHVNAAGA
ncbi:MAG: recombinase family protein [Pseudomonadota bacterium]